MNNKINNILVAISVSMLLLAIADVFSNESQGLRFVVCSTAIYLTLKSRKSGKNAWMWTMLVTAILFNPLLQLVKFDKLDFILVDIIVVCLFIAGLVKIRDDKEVQRLNIKLLRVVFVLLFFIITISVASYSYFLKQKYFP